MAVTELALLTLSPSNPISSPALLANLQKAKTILENASKAPFDFYHEIEQPDHLYIVGSWQSLTAHDEYLKSPENQELLVALKDQVTVDWMFHVDVDPVAVQELLRATSVLAIGRHFVSTPEKDNFTKTFDEGKGELERFIGNSKMVQGGWRLDQKKEREEEWILFTGWESREKRLAFAEDPGFQKHSKIRNHVMGADIKHAILLEL